MLSSSGLGSGLDVNGLVGQLVAAERQPALLRIDRKEVEFQATFSALGSLRSALSEFDAALTGLNDISRFQARNASTTDGNVFLASASDTATPGTYDIEVTQLAEAQQLLSSGFATADTTVGSGTLSLNMGSQNFQVNIASGTDTLADIRDAINNATDNPGITAAIINVDDGVGGTEAKLVLSASDPGLSNTLTVTAADDDGNNTDVAGLSQLVYDAGTTENMSELSPARDSIINLYGQSVTRSTNSLTDVIDGVTIDLKSATPGTTEQLVVSLDTASVTSSVNEFVDAYNSLAQTMSELGRFDSVSGQNGPLIGDSGLRTIQNRIRSELGSALSSTTATFRVLAEVGITTTSEGTLTVDSTKLGEAVTNNMADIAELFAGTEGYATRLSAVVGSYADSDGLLQTRQDSLQSQIEGLADDRVQVNDRMDALESRLLNQFNAMDAIVGQLRTTSDFLSQQLVNLPGFTNNNGS